MGSKNNKLQILAPGAEDPNKVFYETFGVTCLICIVLAATSLQFVFFAEKAAPKEPVKITLKNGDDNEVELTGDAAKLFVLPPEELDELEWTASNKENAFTNGPRLAAEKACEASLKSLAPEDASLLLASLEARAEHAPRVCLVRAYFNKELSAHGKLEGEVASYWGEIERFEEREINLALMVNDYRKTRDRPSDPRFYRWLRHCAMRHDLSTWRPCLQTVRQLSPMQGADMLGMIEIHLQNNPEPTEREIQSIGLMLSLVARHGQPTSWKIDSRSGIEDFDAAMKKAAAFYLCRMVNTPDKVAAKAAADALGEVAGTGARGFHELQLERWREACRITYGGNRPDLEFVEDPILADNTVPYLNVWDGVVGSTPDYSMLAAIKHGHCESRKDKPVWYCGALLWREGDVPTILRRSFVDTRYMEWKN